MNDARLCEIDLEARESPLPPLVALTVLSGIPAIRLALEQTLEPPNKP